MLSSPYLMKSVLRQRRTKVYFVSVLISALVFIFYQYITYVQLTEKEHSIFDIPSIFSQHLMGVHPSKYYLYKTRVPGIFLCLQSKEIISYHKVNDDYCDCKDGSDEPGTNACPQGIFYCASQRSAPGFRSIVPSGWVNDGICDCCDGSDEWEGRSLITSVDKTTQKKIGRFLSPCPNLCL